MDSQRLNEVFEELYIPESPKVMRKEIPSVAPSLIMQDKATDTTHHLKCGCCPQACIHQNAWWGSEEAHVRPSLIPARSSASITTVSHYN